MTESRFLKACRREPVDRTPVWFMRQAGRYMAEYRALRERHSLLEICGNPDLATEVTLQPVKRIDVDAAILFSDLLLPLEPMGLPFDFIKGEGPQLERPIDSTDDIDRLKVFEPREALAHVLDRHPPDPVRAQPAACRSSASPARRSRWRPTRSKADTRTPSPRPRR